MVVISVVMVVVSLLSISKASGSPKFVISFFTFAFYCEEAVIATINLSSLINTLNEEHLICFHSFEQKSCHKIIGNIVLARRFNR